MGKKFELLESQIKHLRDNKAVVIDDEQLVKEVLLKTNYYNFTACCKVKFAKFKGIDGKYVYERSLFDDWAAYYDLDYKLSGHLMINFIHFEREINAKTSYYVSELIESDTLTASKKNDLKQKIKRAKTCANYNLKQTWQYIPKMTFGELVQLLIWLLKHEKSVFLKITVEYDLLHKDIERRLRELNNLRNSLFHGRPLNIYLIYGNVNRLNLNQKKRKLIIVWLFQKRRGVELHSYLQEMIDFAKRFLDIKKQSTHKH